MIIEYGSWETFKNDIISKKFIYNHQTLIDGYKIIVIDRSLIWTCRLISSEDITDFENNYKINSNKSIYDIDGRPYQRNETKPLNATTYFTSCGDICGENPAIGEGTRWEWDASISEGWINDENGAPEGMKQIIKEAQFCDSIWLKEGKIFFNNCIKNSYFDLAVICPNGDYYSYLGEIRQNTTGQDLVVEQYINKHPIQGETSTGLFIVPESCSSELPTYMKLRWTITVPEEDNISSGCFLAMLFRNRTKII